MPKSERKLHMSTQQWHRTLVFMTIFLAIAWSALGITPGTSLATEEYINYFPPPQKSEIDAVLRNVSRRKLILAKTEVPS
jgi:hypothetical protein